MTHDPLELLTVREVAALLKLEKTTLDQWRHYRAGPPFIRLGTSRTARIRYRRIDVEAWLDSHGTGWEARSQGGGSLPHPQQSPRPASDGAGRAAGLCVRRYVRRTSA
jgi:predicted DNA-binding transcriptional regulator AlpA